MSQTAAPFMGVSGVAGNRTFPRIGQLRGQGVGAVLAGGAGRDAAALAGPGRRAVSGPGPASARTGAEVITVSLQAVYRERCSCCLST